MGLRYPHTIWVVPTTKCNTRCRTCGHFYADYGEDMHPDIFARIENEVLDHVQRVHLVGGGEPLVSKIFPAMLEACFKRGIKVFFITNTIALTEELMRVLVEHDAEIMVSLDGATAETFNSIRPHINFERLMAKLEMIRSVRERSPDSTFRLLTNTVVMRRNLHELRDIVALADRYGVDTATFSDLIPHALDPDFTEEVPVAHPHLIREHAPAAVALAHERKLNIEMPSYYADHLPKDAGTIRCSDGPLPHQDSSRKDIIYADKQFIFPKRCHMPWTHANFLVDGTVSTCCITSYSLGNLRESSFDAIWNGARYQAARRTIHTDNPPRACRHCNLGDGIAAGNPSFFANFLTDNHLRSVPLDGPQGVLTTHDGDRTGAFGPEQALEVTVPSGDAAFLALRLEAPTELPGRVIVKDNAHLFCGDDATVLVPLPEPTGNGPTSVRLESPAPGRLVGLDLLSYKNRAINLNLTITKPLLDQFHDQFITIENRLEAILADNPGLKTAVIFGANPVGGKLRDMVEAKGLSVIGFVDNFVSYFELAIVNVPQDLEALRPDVVVIASKTHASAMAAQVRQTATYGPVVIPDGD